MLPGYISVLDQLLFLLYVVFRAGRLFTAARGSDHSLPAVFEVINIRRGWVFVSPEAAGWDVCQSRRCCCRCRRPVCLPGRFPGAGLSLPSRPVSRPASIRRSVPVSSCTQPGRPASAVSRQDRPPRPARRPRHIPAARRRVRRVLGRYLATPRPSCRLGRLQRPQRRHLRAPLIVAPSESRERLRLRAESGSV